MPISYKRRRDNAVSKAVAIIKPYVLEYLTASQSIVLNPMVGDPLVEGVRKHFLGIKGYKNEELARIHPPLNEEEINKAVLQAIRECRAGTPGLDDHLAKKNAERKAELAKPKPFRAFARGAGKAKRVRKFKPLMTTERRMRERLAEQVILNKMEEILRRKSKK